MITHLTIGVPKTLVDRSGYDKKTLEQFERVTGIKKTRRFSGSMSRLIRQTLKAAVAKYPFFMCDSAAQVIVVTQTPDRLSPCMAMGVHQYLDLTSDVAAFDVNQSCVGFLYGLELASRSGGDTILVCVDKLRFGNPGTLDALMFSDACAVAYVTQSKAGGAYFDNNGLGSKHLYMRASGKMKMDGAKTFNFAVETVPPLIKTMNAAFGYDYLCPHQANLSILNLIEKRSGFDGRMLKSIEEYGNQSMVSIPTALAYNEQDILGKSVLLCGFGAGWSAAAMGLPKWSTKPITQIVEV